MKLIDCFMYFDEDVVLDMRLNILNKIVDKFVIVESKKDHAGNSKKLNFEFNKFNKFKDKIKYLVVEDLPFKKKIIFLLLEKQRLMAKRKLSKKLLIRRIQRRR